MTCVFYNSDDDNDGDDDDDDDDDDGLSKKQPFVDDLQIRCS